MTNNIVILGDGAMATVCANIIASKADPSREVRMWVREPSHLAAIEAKRENVRYLPGVKLAPALRLMPTGPALFEGVGLILAAAPTQYIRGALTQLGGFIPASVPVVSVAKGIEIATLKRPSEIILEMLG